MDQLLEVPERKRQSQTMGIIWEILGTTRNISFSFILVCAFYITAVFLKT